MYYLHPISNLGSSIILDTIRVAVDLQLYSNRLHITGLQLVVIMLQLER